MCLKVCLPLLRGLRNCMVRISDGMDWQALGRRTSSSYSETWVCTIPGALNPLGNYSSPPREAFNGGLGLREDEFVFGVTEFTFRVP